MDRIIEKLKKVKGSFDGWSPEDKLKLLEIYYLISKKETRIFDLIYEYHGCDSWEDMFRDYDSFHFKEKARGVKVAIREMKTTNESIDESTNADAKESIDGSDA